MRFAFNNLCESKQRVRPADFSRYGLSPYSKLPFIKTPLYVEISVVIGCEERWLGAVFQRNLSGRRGGKTGFARSRAGGGGAFQFAANRSTVGDKKSASGHRAAPAESGSADRIDPTTLRPGQPPLSSVSYAGTVHGTIRPDGTGLSESHRLREAERVEGDRDQCEPGLAGRERFGGKYRESVSSDHADLPASDGEPDVLRSGCRTVH